VRKFLENDVAKENGVSSCWEDYFAGEISVLDGGSQRSIPNFDSYFPKLVERAAPVPPPASRPTRRATYPLADTIEHNAYRPSHRNHAIRASALTDRRLSDICGELTPGTFAFARFELDADVTELLSKVDAGDDDAELGASDDLLARCKETGGYRAPLCLVKLPRIAIPQGPDDEFMVTWFRPSNERYTGKWSEWRVKELRGPGSRAWTSSITRASIVKGLENVEFTRGTATARSKQISAKTRKILQMIHEARYAEFS